jgi:hypothetical protein
VYGDVTKCRIINGTKVKNREDCISSVKDAKAHWAVQPTKKKKGCAILYDAERG